MDKNMLSLGLIALAFVALVWIGNRAQKKLEAAEPPKPILIPSKEEAKKLLGRLTTQDQSLWKAPEGVTPLRELLAVVAHQDGVHCSVESPSARGLVLPICAARIARDIEAVLKAKVTPETPLLRGESAVEGPELSTTLDMGEIGGFDLYSVANEGAFLLLQNMTGQGHVFGPLQLGDLKVLAERFRAALETLPANAAASSIVKLNFDVPKRDVYEVDTDGSKRKIA